MTLTFTATFTNNPVFDDVRKFAESHGIDCRLTVNQTFEFFSDNRDCLEEAHYQLIALNPSEIE